MKNSDTIWRICCWNPRWREYKGSIFTDDQESELMYNYEKSCGIPFFCLWRPEIKVYDHDEELLGSIHNIFKWWKMVMEIRDTH